MKELFEKYGSLVGLSDSEKKAIEGMQTKPVAIGAGLTLTEEESHGSDNLYVVRSGRLFSSQDLASGDRAITRLYFSGDVIGTANVPFNIAVQTVTASVESTLYRFEREKLADTFFHHPRVAAMFYTFAALENAILQDRLVSVGRTSGLSRIAAIIMEIATRRELTGANIAEPFELKLKQAEIGDAVGLTHIHVNRLMRELERSSLIARKGTQLQILDPVRLAEVGHFLNRYEDVDTGWFEE